MEKRVCLLTETYHPVTGGGETQARALARGLTRRGWSVLILTRRSDASQPREEWLDGARIVRLPPAGASRKRKWGLLLTAFWGLMRRRGDYAAVVVSGFRILGVPAVMATRLLGRVCLLKADSLGEMSGRYFAAGLETIGLTPTSLPFRALLKLRNGLFRRAERFIAISSSIERELAQSAVGADRIVAIPNSVDVARFHPVDAATRDSLRRRLGLPVDRVLTTYTGRLVSYKGLFLLLDAWRSEPALQEAGTLLFVGSGGLDIHNCEGELRGSVARYGLEDSVRFAGEVHDVRELLQASDVFVLPSESEAFGISLIEAMATGLAVVSSDAGGLSDIVSDGMDGLRFPSGDGSRLRHALRRLHADAALREKLGSAARESAVARYSTEMVVERYEEVLMSHLAPEALPSAGVTARVGRTGRVSA